MAVLLQDIINDYYDLQGDDPPSLPTAQDLRLINRTLDDITRRYQFGFARTSTDLSLVSLQASLPSNFAYPYDLRYVYSGTEDDKIFRYVDEESNDSTAEAIYWITGDTQTHYAINTNISTYNPLKITYYRKPSYMSNLSDTTFFPSSEVIALGAYLRKRKLENPDIDVTQEKQEYELAIRQLISYDQRVNGRKGRYKGVHEAFGFRTGE